MEKRIEKTNNLLAILAKYPYSGNSKTRLIHDVGFEKASKFSHALLSDLVDAHALCRAYNICIFLSENDKQYEDDMLKMFPEGSFNYLSGKELRGEESKLYELFNCYATKYDKVIAIYSDTPYITEEIVSNAFELLKCDNDIALGTDGAKGYYLIGMTKAHDIFTKVSSQRVPYLEQTISLAKNLNLNVHYVESLPDIDNLNDIVNYSWLNDLNNDLWKKTRNMAESIRSLL